MKAPRGRQEKVLLVEEETTIDAIPAAAKAAILKKAPAASTSDTGWGKI